MTDSPIAPGAITGLVLAGGQGLRMGGADKGLQHFRSQPLALHALQRLQAQQGGLIGPVALNANRHLPDYAAWGHPVWPDALPEGVPAHPGPLAGFLAGLAHCTTPWLLVVPCDVPAFPLNLAMRLAALAHAPIPAAVTLRAPVDDPAATPRLQPTFGLLHAADPALRDNLSRFLQTGGRKVGLWLAGLDTRTQVFGPGDTPPQAFTNLNTLAELQALEHTRHP